MAAPKLSDATNPRPYVGDGGSLFVPLRASYASQTGGLAARSMATATVTRNRPTNRPGRRNANSRRPANRIPIAEPKPTSCHLHCCVYQLPDEPPWCVRNVTDDMPRSVMELAAATPKKTMSMSTAPKNAATIAIATRSVIGPIPVRMSNSNDSAMSPRISRL